MQLSNEELDVVRKMAMEDFNGHLVVRLVDEHRKLRMALDGVHEALGESEFSDDESLGEIVKEVVSAWKTRAEELQREVDTLTEGKGAV